MTPRPQLSLCIPVTAAAGLSFALLEEANKDLQAFFKKFPLIYEVLVMVPVLQDQSRRQVQSLTEQHPQLRVIENSGRRSRARSLEQLFSAARGDVLIAIDLDLATPLSEVFKILEAFYSDRETDAIFGNRYTTSQKASSSVPPVPLEEFFAGILKEKTAWPFADPFCPVLGLRRSAFEKIRADLHSRGWHWTPEVQHLCQLHHLKAIELPISTTGPQKTKPPKSEALHLFRFILFRV